MKFLVWIDKRFVAVGQYSLGLTYGHLDFSKLFNSSSVGVVAA